MHLFEESGGRERALDPGIKQPSRGRHAWRKNLGYLLCHRSARVAERTKELAHAIMNSFVIQQNVLALCRSCTMEKLANSFSVEATLEELAPAQRTEIAKRHWHDSF